MPHRARRQDLSLHVSPAPRLDASVPCSMVNGANADCVSATASNTACTAAINLVPAAIACSLRRPPRLTSHSKRIRHVDQRKVNTHGISRTALGAVAKRCYSFKAAFAVTTVAGAVAFLGIADKECEASKTTASAMCKAYEGTVSTCWTAPPICTWTPGAVTGGIAKCT